jgi:single-stranded-DNA-specific exonuclease
MKYNLIGENDYTDPIEQILNNRGVKDKDKFLHPSQKAEIHYSKLKNIHKAVACLLEHIEKEDDVYIQPDADVDGLASSAIIIQYLNNLYPQYIKNHLTYKLHNGKQHGILAKNIPDNIKLVIVPDAAVRMEEQKQLYDRGIDTIIIDHHDVEDDSKYSILVNNQISKEYSNKALVGTGMVYKFIKALDDKLNIHSADQYLDLVALGHISDIADIRDPEVIYYIQTGLNQIKNSFLKELIEKQSFSMKGEINPTSIGWYISPLLNSVIRSGNKEEKEMTFKALLGSTEQVYYKRGDCYESIQKHMARQLTNVKRRQDKARDSDVVSLEDTIKKKHLDKNKILFVIGNEKLEKNFSGLICSKLAVKYKRPTLVGKPYKNEFILGSIRGYDKGIIKDFKQVLQDTNLFEFVEGHPQAAGFQIKTDNIPLVIDKLNNKYKNIEIDVEEYDVDFDIPVENLNESFINEIYDYHNFWGHGVEEPNIIVNDLSVSKNDIYLIGKKKNVLKFYHGNIEFIKYFYNEDKFNELFSEGETFYINVIGKCGINEWNGNKKSQIIIDEIEVADILYF